MSTNPLPTPALIERAQRLWPDSQELQRRWLQAVRQVRSTKAGWVLDRRAVRHA